MEDISHHVEKGDISIVIKDGQKGSTIDALYVPLMTSNLISVGQLLVKGYYMKLEKNHMMCIMVMEG